MVPTNLPDPGSEVHHPCEACSTCLHWNTTLSPIYALVAGRRIQMAQCLAGDNSSHEAAPYAEIQGPYEAAVFTYADCRCPAFEVDPEVAEEMYASIVHYAELDNQLTREAWAM